MTRLLIEEGAEIDAITHPERGRTPLGAAALIRGDTKTVEILLEAGADVNRSFSYGWPTTWAVTHNEAMTRLLISWGATAPLWHPTQDSVLAAAATNPDVDFFKALLSEAEAAGTGPDLSKDIQNLLNRAVTNPNMDTLEYLITLNQQGPDSLTQALTYTASIWGNPLAVDVLVDAGAQLTGTIRGETALHVLAASPQHHHEVLNALLRRGADVNAQDDNGGTPLFRAISSTCATHTTPYSRRFLEMLLEAGADPNIQTNDGYTPCTWCRI